MADDSLQPSRAAEGGSQRKTEINFHLTSPITYAHGGQSYEASFIRLSAPNSKVSRECAALKQAFARALLIQQQQQGPRTEVTEKDDVPDPTGDEVILLLAQSSGVDLPDVLEVGRRLLLAPGIAKIDGEVRLTSHLLDLVDQDDFERMIGDYLVGFTLASLFSKMRQS